MFFFDKLKLKKLQEKEKIEKLEKTNAILGKTVNDTKMMNMYLGQSITNLKLALIKKEEESKGSVVNGK